MLLPHLLLEVVADVTAVCSVMLTRSWMQGVGCLAVLCCCLTAVRGLVHAQIQGALDAIPGQDAVDAHLQPGVQHKGVCTHTCVSCLLSCMARAPVQQSRAVELWRRA